MTATASTILNSDQAEFGPQLAIDGKFSRANTGYYHGTTTSYPWYQTVFDRTVNINGIRIYNRYSCCGNRLKHIEVRAGRTEIAANYSGNIAQNTFCGSFIGPGANGGVYTINCDSPIEANVITIQIVEAGDQVLQLDEVEFIILGEVYGDCPICNVYIYYF